MNVNSSSVCLVVLVASVFAVGALASGKADKGSVKYSGMYVEGCSCSPPCPCELTGVEMGCQGVGGFAIERGSFEGMDVSGVKFAYAVVPGDWVKCYVDAPTAAKRKAATALAEAAFQAWGKMLPTAAAKISITGGGGRYTLKVNGGKVMSLTTEPVMGIDNKTPITISNIKSVLHPVVKQGRIRMCTFSDEGKSFEIEGSNAYFNSRLVVNGTISYTSK